MDPEYPKRRPVRSYVLRQGRMTPGQQRAFDDAYPKFGLTLSDEPADFDAIFGRQAPTVLEIGFGMGDSLATMCAENPELNFVGVEVHKPGVGHLLALAEENELTNLRIYHQDVMEVLENAISERSLDRVQIFFPDPWPKKKHHKRRLISPSFLDVLATRLKTGGLIHVATDWAHYAEEIEELFSTRADYEQTGAPSRPKTKYEARGVRLGHNVTDLAYSLKS